MASMSITLSGAKEAVAKLGVFNVITALRPAMQRSMYRLQYTMQDYPPAPPNSLYVRTGTLGRRWTTDVSRSGNTLTGKVGNNTAYGPFVQSKRFQRRFHARTGWVTDERALSENQAAIVKDFEGELQRAIKQGGL